MLIDFSALLDRLARRALTDRPEHPERTAHLEWKDEQDIRESQVAPDDKDRQE